MNPWLLLVLYALTVHRVSRLLVADTLPIIDRPREWVKHHFGRFDSQGDLIGARRWGVVGWSIAYLLGCSWCMSVYVGASLIFGPLGDVSIPLPWLWVAAASTVAGLLGGIVESEHELRYERMQAEIDNLRSRR
jgi:hypothetical protein